MQSRVELFNAMMRGAQVRADVIKNQFDAYRAERTAVFKAVSEGEREFEAIAIVCSGKTPAAPCGVCRQVLREFCNSDFPVIFADSNRNVVESTLGELLPHSFGPEDLL